MEREGRKRDKGWKGERSEGGERKEEGTWGTGKQGEGLSSQI